MLSEQILAPQPCTRRSWRLVLPPLIDGRFVTPVHLLGVIASLCPEALSVIVVVAFRASHVVAGEPVPPVSAHHRRWLAGVERHEISRRTHPAARDAMSSGVRLSDVAGDREQEVQQPIQIQRVIPFPDVPAGNDHGRWGGGEFTGHLANGVGVKPTGLGTPLERPLGEPPFQRFECRPYLQALPARVLYLKHALQCRNDCTEGERRLID